MISSIYKTIKIIITILTTNRVYTFKVVTVSILLPFLVISALIVFPLTDIITIMKSIPSCYTLDKFNRNGSHHFTFNVYTSSGPLFCCQCKYPARSGAMVWWTPFAVDQAAVDSEGNTCCSRRTKSCCLL